VFLQYVLGFRKLGWDVLFLDRLEPEMCTDETGARAPLEHSANVRYFVDVMSRFGLDGCYGLLSKGNGGNGSNGTASTIGLNRAQIIERVAASSALINVMGFLDDEEILAAAPQRVFLDIDPGFGQMWCALGQHDAFRGHDAHVTIAENIGKPSCAIPTCGLEWVTTKQPVVMDEWTDVGGTRCEHAAITSVASWRGAYGPVEYRGRTYGLRVHELRKFAALPRLCRQPFELALEIHPSDHADRALLEASGWTLVEPAAVAGDPWSYRAYVQGSRGELMVAKNMYVQANSGWFSDRSICYLASGRPVVAQDTGFRRHCPTGQGLIAFATLDEAAAGIEEDAREPGRHARAARAIAEEHFDSDRVLRRLLDDAGVS
jgi:hypothetical protein